MTLVENLVKQMKVRSPEERADEAKRRRERVAAHYINNTRKYRHNETNYRARLRATMIEAYGGKCVECSENDPIVLVLDHVFDDAQEDRALNNHKGGYHLYAKLKKANWPKENYQLLCHNCNFRKEYHRRKGRAIKDA